jgi:hypothetical protein
VLARSFEIMQHFDGRLKRREHRDGVEEMTATRSSLGGIEFICVDCPFHTQVIREIVKHGKANPEHTLDFVYEERDNKVLIDALKYFGFIKNS